MASSILINILANGSQAIGEFNRLGATATRQLGSIGRLTTLGLVGGLAIVGKAVFDLGLEYEGAMNEIQAVTQATDSEMKALGSTAMRLGSDLTLPGASAADAARAMRELSKAGLDVTETQEAARGTLLLAAAANIDAAKAAEIQSNALNAFGLEAASATKVADLLAATAAASSVEIKDVADSFSMASAVFASFQGPAVGAERAMVDLATAIGILGNAGIKGSDAGTSLKQMMLQLAAPAQATKQLMRGLLTETSAYGNSIQFALDKKTTWKGTIGELMTAMSTLSTKQRESAVNALEQAGAIKVGGDIAYDAAGNMRSLDEIVRLTTEGTKGMTQEARQFYVAQIFGADASRAMLILMAAQGKETDKMSAAVLRSNAAAELAAAKSRGLGGAVEALKSQFETMAIVVSQSVFPALSRMVLALAGQVMPAFDTLGRVIGRMGDAMAPFFANADNLAAVFSALQFAAVALAGAAGLGVLLTVLGLLLSPIGILVAGAAALGYALQSAYPGVDLLSVAFNALKDALSSIISFLQPVIDFIGNNLTAVFSGLGAAIAVLVGGTGLSMLVALFGTILGPAFLVAAAIGAIVGALVYLYQNNETAKRIMDDLWSWAQHAIPAAIEVIKAAIAEFVAAARAWWAEHGADVKAAAREAYGFLQEEIVPTLQAIGQFIQTSLRGWVFLWREFGDDIAAAARTAWSGIAAVVGPALTAIGALIRSVMAAIRGDWSSAWELLQQAASAGARSIIAAVGLLNSGLRSAISAATSAAQSAFSAGMNALVSFAATIPGRISAGLAALPGLLSAVIRSAWSAGNAAFAQGAATVVAFARSIPSRIVAAFSALPALLASAGANAMAGLLRGLSYGAGAVIAKARSVAGAVADAMTGFWQQRSPSRLFYGFGVNITEGLRLGLEAGAPAPIAAAKTLAVGLAGVAAGALRENIFMTIGQTAINGIAAGIQVGTKGAVKAMEAMADAVKKQADRVRDAVSGVLGLVKSNRSLTDAQENVTEATEDLNVIRARASTIDARLKAAEDAVTAARNAGEEGARNLSEAERNLAELQKEKLGLGAEIKTATDKLTDAEFALIDAKIANYEADKKLAESGGAAISMWEAYARAAGITASEIDKVSQALGRIPTNVTSTVTVNRVFAGPASDNDRGDGAPGFGGAYATGGFFPARRGGYLGLIGEGREDEVLAPEPMLRRIIAEESGGGGLTVNIHVAGSVLSERDLVGAVVAGMRREGIVRPDGSIEVRR